MNALKAMTHNLTYGDQVSHILNSNPVWAEYRDQKHDLFITDTNVRGYLTGENTKNKRLFFFYLLVVLNCLFFYQAIQRPAIWRKGPAKISKYWRHRHQWIVTIHLLGTQSIRPFGNSIVYRKEIVLGHLRVENLSNGGIFCKSLWPKSIISICGSLSQ